MQGQRGCSRCGVENIATARFCMACGAPLEGNCPACGAQVQPQARFCVSCGAMLSSAAGGLPRVAPTFEEERRTVTVVFADLVGYTSVSERFDAETVKALTERCLTRLAAEVERFGGYVDQYIGDNVMAVFGAPVSHEDDAERAVRAAAGMQAAMAELNRGIGSEFGCELALRVGVNTGEVLAGRIGDEYTVVGDAVNVAARLQGAAEVGEIWVGEATQRLSAQAASYREVGPLTLKGKAEPVCAWALVGLRESAPLAQGRAPLTPLIGRRADLALLEAQFEHVALERAPRAVTIVGEAGVGKTRLVRELERRLKRRVPPTHTCRGRCPAAGAGSVYWPLSEIVRAECGILSGDSGSQARAKLIRRFAPLLAAEEHAEEIGHKLAPLARLLGVQTAADEELLSKHGEDPRSARDSFFGAVRSALEALAGARVLMLVWEDIHWADEGTLDLIEYLARWLRGPVMQVSLAREELLERRPAWRTGSERATTIALKPLAAHETRELIDVLALGSGVVVEEAHELTERSGGNPLFAEALVERLGEGYGAAASELPDSIHRVLAARLDALEPFERQLLAHAAVLGATFWEEALEPVAARAQRELAGALETLCEKNLIVPNAGRQPEGEREFAFKHVLIRDVAYEMLPKAVRARKHAEVGALIERHAGERGEGVAALLAGHFGQGATLAADMHLPAVELSRLREKAFEWHGAAGDAAAALYSNQEALSHYDAALSFAGSRNEPSARTLQTEEKSGDVALRLGRVAPAIAAWQRCLAYHRAQNDLPRMAEMHRKIGAALAHQGERKAAIAELQRGITLVRKKTATGVLVRLYEQAAQLYMQVGANMLAMYAAEQALHLTESLGEARAASRACGIIGRVFGRCGDTGKAREHLERAVALGRESGPDQTVVALLALGAHLEQCEGDYGGAAPTYEEALALAEHIGDVPAQIELRFALAQLAFYRCDWRELRRASDAAADLAEHEGLVGKLCLPDTSRGQLCWREGDLDSAERLFRGASDTAAHVGWSEVCFSALVGLAATLRDRDQLDAAEAAFARAGGVAERAGLIPQTVQAWAALACTRLLAGSAHGAREAAVHALSSVRRAPSDPVARAAGLEAHGIVAGLPQAVDSLHGARAAWEQLGRRLDMTRCEMLLGHRLRASDPQAAGEALDCAAAAYEELGVRHLAARARELLGAWQ